MALAYAGLKQDGFVRSRRRAGYFVDRRALADPAHADLAQSEVRDVGSARMDYAAHFRGRSFDVRRVVKPPDCLVRYRYPFVCGLIDPAMFPISSWRECVRDSVNVVEVGNWATDYSATDDPMLVEQLIERVLSRRGIAAHPDEVLMTVGGQQALFLALKLLLQRGETFGVEDPGYPDMVNMARFEGMRVVRLPVDSGGLVLSGAAARCKCLYVTPSHQFPTTVTMPTERKLELLRLTRANGQFVIEDDYEADVSFNRTPPPALKSLDAWGNVVYVGSLSKSLLPGLRVGYLVADRDFVARGTRVAPPHPAPPASQQPALRRAIHRARLLRSIRREADDSVPRAFAKSCTSAWSAECRVPP